MLTLEKLVEPKGKGEEYLAMIFKMLRNRDALMVETKDARFNNTEIRLIREVILEKARGGRVISTELARRLGITRSAVSQMVNHLEERGVVVRVAAEDDRKIAYVEISEGVIETYSGEINECIRIVSELVEKFGEERFMQMYELYQEFTDMAKEHLQNKR